MLPRQILQKFPGKVADAGKIRNLPAMDPLKELLSAEWLLSILLRQTDHFLFCIAS